MKKFFPVVILTIISAFLIFYRFTEIPRYLAFDEVEFAKLALSLEEKPYIPYSQLATGHSTLYFYIILASLKTFGINTFALRFPAAIFGILSVMIFYFIMQNIYQKNKILDTKYLILNTLILLSSRWFLNFARFSFEATFLLFLELTSIYFLLRFDEVSKAKISNFLRFDVFRQKILISSFYLIFSGIFAGLSFLSYTPGRIFFLLPLCFLIYRFVNPLLAHRQWNNQAMKQLLLFLIPFIIIITPLTSYLLTNKDPRIDQQFFLKNHEMTINEKVNGLWSNISSTTLMFFTKGDMNGRHNYPGKPALNPILNILLIIGLIITMKQWNNSYNKFFIFYFLLSILPALMTYPWENPNMLRTYTSLPAIVYFVGLAILFFVNLINKMIKIKTAKYLILNTLYFILIFSCFYELRTYFKYQSIVFNQSFEIKLPLEKAIKSKVLP